MIMYTTLKILSRKPDTNTLHSRKWRLEKKLWSILFTLTLSILVCQIHLGWRCASFSLSILLSVSHPVLLLAVLEVWVTPSPYHCSPIEIWWINMWTLHIIICLVQQEMTYLGYQINESFQVTCWYLFLHFSFLHSMFMTTFMSV